VTLSLLLLLLLLGYNNNSDMRSVPDPKPYRVYIHTYTSITYMPTKPKKHNHRQWRSEGW